ncbi:curlin associated protein [Qipengyuania citrea LAMA 915]|uniref:Curlin associated protein n=1 Tax=Qipengyuania citrea LAMA 915 TaxID=1306953 RepID=A0A0L1KEX0_9SPHN|nr:curlin associated protein [Qipengyuania citrea LAMA 915]
MHLAPRVLAIARTGRMRIHPRTALHETPKPSLCASRPDAPDLALLTWMEPKPP